MNTTPHTVPDRRQLRRNRLPEALGQQLNTLIADAKKMRALDTEAAWAHLEDAHVLSQPWIRPHVRVHVAMLGLGWSQRDRGEVIGQLARLIVAGPGSATGRYPVGNIGRATVSAFEPMPIRADLARALDDHDTASPKPVERSGTGLASRARRLQDQVGLYKVTGWLGGPRAEGVRTTRPQAGHSRRSTETAATATGREGQGHEVRQEPRLRQHHDRCRLPTQRARPHVRPVLGRLLVRTIPTTGQRDVAGHHPILRPIVWNHNR